jgi:hypothetical protein
MRPRYADAISDSDDKENSRLGRGMKCGLGCYVCAVLVAVSAIIVGLMSTRAFASYMVHLCGHDQQLAGLLNGTQLSVSDLFVLRHPLAVPILSVSTTLFAATCVIFMGMVACLDMRCRVRPYIYDHCACRVGYKQVAPLANEPTAAGRPMDSERIHAVLLKRWQDNIRKMNDDACDERNDRRISHQLAPMRRHESAQGAATPRSHSETSDGPDSQDPPAVPDRDPLPATDGNATADALPVSSGTKFDVV